MLDQKSKNKIENLIEIKTVTQFITHFKLSNKIINFVEQFKNNSKNDIVENFRVKYSSDVKLLKENYSIISQRNTKSTEFSEVVNKFSNFISNLVNSINYLTKKIQYKVGKYNKYSNYNIQDMRIHYYDPEIFDKVGNIFTHDHQYKVIKSDELLRKYILVVLKTYNIDQSSIDGFYKRIVKK